MEKFKVFRMSDSENQINPVLACIEITTVEELQSFMRKPENHQLPFVLKNSKGEYVNHNLEVIISPLTSMSSMVDLMKNKFESKRNVQAIKRT